MVNSSQLKIELYQLVELLAGKEFIRKKYLSFSVKKYLNANCVFIHIPKAAGTSIATAVIGERAGHFTALEVKNYMGDEKFHAMFSFSICREPLRKLFSAYQYVKKGGGTHGGVRREVYFEAPEFRSFDAFVQEWLVKQKLNEMNLLFRPQYLFVCDENQKQLVTHIGKVEELEAVQVILSKQLSRNIHFKELNRTGSLKPTDLNISPRTKMLVEELYEKDYSFFKY